MADLGKVMVTPKGAYSSVTRYERLDLVTYNGSAYIALRDVTGVTPAEDGENWQLHGQGYPGNAVGVEATDTSGIIGSAGSKANVQTLLDEVAERVTNVSGAAVDITATDTSGLVVAAGGSSNMQALIDAVADKVMTELLLKSDVVSQAVNDPNKAASAALVYAMQQQLDQQNSDYEKITLIDSTAVVDQKLYTLPDGWHNTYREIDWYIGCSVGVVYIVRSTPGDLLALDGHDNAHRLAADVMGPGGHGINAIFVVSTDGIKTDFLSYSGNWNNAFMYINGIK